MRIFNKKDTAQKFIDSFDKEASTPSEEFNNRLRKQIEDNLNYENKNMEIFNILKLKKLAFFAITVASILGGLLIASSFQEVNTRFQLIEKIYANNSSVIEYIANNNSLYNSVDNQYLKITSSFLDGKGIDKCPSFAVGSAIHESHSYGNNYYKTVITDNNTNLSTIDIQNLDKFYTFQGGEFAVVNDIELSESSDNPLDEMTTDQLISLYFGDNFEIFENENSYVVNQNDGFICDDNNKPIFRQSVVDKESLKITSTNYFIDNINESNLLYSVQDVVEITYDLSLSEIRQIFTLDDSISIRKVEDFNNENIFELFKKKVLENNFTFFSKKDSEIVSVDLGGYFSLGRYYFDRKFYPKGRNGDAQFESILNLPSSYNVIYEDELVSMINWTPENMKYVESFEVISNYTRKILIDNNETNLELNEVKYLDRYGNETGRGYKGTFEYNNLKYEVILKSNVDDFELELNTTNDYERLFKLQYLGV